MRWIPANGMLCHDMARITTLCFQFVYPSFQKRDAKVIEFFHSPNFIENIFNFYSAAEADILDVQWPPMPESLPCRWRVSLRGVEF